MLRKLIMVTIALLICRLGAIASPAAAADSPKGCPTVPELYLEEAGAAGHWKTKSGWEGLAVKTRPTIRDCAHSKCSGSNILDGHYLKVDKLVNVVVKSPHASGHGAPHEVLCIYSYIDYRYPMYLDEPSEDKSRAIAVRNLNEWAKESRPGQLGPDRLECWISEKYKCEFDLYR